MLVGTKEIPTEEIGDLWTLEGCVYGNGKESVVLELPFVSYDNEEEWVAEWVKPTDEQLQAFIAQTDDPVTPIGKALVRKTSRQLDQSIVWRYYYRDNYTCVYCGASGVILTYDHYLAQKYGGQTTMENGRTSCRPCNKLKGHLTIDAWKELASQRGLNAGENVTDKV